MKTKRFFIFMLVAVILAIAVRAVVCIQLFDAPDVQVPNPQTDMATYKRLALDVLDGKWPDHFDYQPLYYTLLLPPILAFKSAAVPVLMTIQTAFAALAVAAIASSTALLFGRRPAIIAAFLLALAKFHAFYTPFMLYEVLQSFWISMLFLLLILAWKRNTWKLWLAAAAILSLAALTRGNALFFLPGIIVFQIHRNRRTPKRACAIAAAILTIYFVPQLPFSIKNYHYTGRWCGASTAGDKVLALGNTPEAPPGGLEYPWTYHHWCKLSDKRPEEGRISVPTNILRWFAQNPAQVIELQFRKLLLFWHKQEIPNNVNIEHHGRDCTILPYLLPFWIIAIPALAFLLTGWKRTSPRHHILAYLVLAFCAATVLFYILARFRIAIIPMLCILAGAFVERIIIAIKNYKARPSDQARRRILLLGLATVASSAIVLSAFTLYQDLYEADVAKAITPNGIAVGDDSTTLVYDHGPLTIGGIIPFPLESQPLAIHKRLIVPPDKVKLTQGAPFVARIIAVPNQHGQYPSMTFIHNNQTVKPILVQDRFIHWMQADFKSLQLEQDGSTSIEIIVDPGQAPGSAIGIDRLRNYGRTTFKTPSQQLNLFAEATVEIQSNH